jgi:hypothetical protein
MKTKKIFPRLSGWNLLFIVGLCAAVSIIILSNVNSTVVNAAGTISGRVFQDFNANGTFNTTTTITNDGSGTIGMAIDRGVAGVTVSAYDSSGTLRGTATTIADGTYSLTATGTGPYRVEFTTLPTGFFPSARSKASVLAGTTTNSGSTVQFVADLNTTNVNLAVNYPTEYTQNNPQVAVSLYKAGDQGTGATAFPVLRTFPYSAGSTDTGAAANIALFDNPTASALSIEAIDMGTTYGLAYSRTNRLLYAGAYFKRHAGFAVGGPNQIYVVDRIGVGNIIANFTVPGTATNAHQAGNYPRDNGDIGWDAVGKTSLGGLAISEDETFLFVYNLANRTLYKLNRSTGAQITAQATLPTLPVTVGNCAANDRRPFALTVYRGVLYAGFVCSAESSATVDTFTDNNPANGQYDGGDYYVETNGTAGRQATEPYMDLDGDGNYDAGEAFVDNDGNGVYNIGDTRSLRAYVFTVDQTTLAYSASPVFTLPLNYRRGVNVHSQGGFAQWRPWSATYRNVNNSNTVRLVYPQPMLNDIAFDNGNLILGLRDRASDQVGNGTLSNPSDASNFNFYQVRPGGDIIRACGAVGAWTVESNGRCGGTGTSTQNSGEGIGPTSTQSGEFYHGDAFTLSTTLTGSATVFNGKGSNHDETASGGIEQFPGAPDVMMVNFDPIPNVTSETHDGGIRWLNNTTGAFTKGYRLYDGDSGSGDDFGKAGGAGGNLTILADPAPIEIGNRVWRDTDRDGVQDPQESRAATTPVLMTGVTVRLYNSSNVLVATALTDQDGEYYFSSAAGTNTGNTIYNLNLLPNTTYQVRFDNPANYTAGGPLSGLLLTTVNQTSQTGDDDSSDSDASYVANPVGSPSAGTYPVISLTTGAAGSNNHTFDVGFAPPGPTAANVIVGGRVTTASGMGIANTTVTLSDMTGARRTALTNAFGYFQFTDIQAGQTVIVTVLSKRYTFSQPSRAVDAGEDIFNVNFVADN